MSRTHLEFYALPDEQKEWLQRWISDEVNWAVLWRSRMGEPLRDPQKLASALEVVGLDFSADQENALIIYLGNREQMDEPVWHTITADRKDIDFIRSQAIQFMPSLLVGDDILTEGRLAIMRERQYEEHGIDPKLVIRWFGRISRSFRSMRSRGATVLLRGTDGGVKELRSVVITPGAVEWRRAGRRLKQISRGPVEFDVSVG